MAATPPRSALGWRPSSPPMDAAPPERIDGGSHDVQSVVAADPPSGAPVRAVRTDDRRGSGRAGRRRVCSKPWRGRLVVAATVHRRPARTAGAAHRAGRRAGTRSPAPRGPSPPGSARRARRAGTAPIRPRLTSAIAASMATITAFDFGAVARWMTACARGIRASGSPTKADASQRGHRRLQRRRVGHADVLAGVDHQPAGDEARVLARLDHPGQVVQGGVDVAAADALDEARW